MAILGDPRAAQLRPQKRYRFSEHGPIVCTRAVGSVTAVGPTGRTAVVEASAFEMSDHVPTQLAAGVDVRIDGVVAGRLVQPAHGSRRAQRRIEFHEAIPGTFPPAPHFRLRGMLRVTAENASGSLIRQPRVVPGGMGRLTVAAGVGHDFVLVYAAASSGLVITMTYGPS